MKILIYESTTIQELVTKLIREHDPDFPAGDGTGLSNVVNRLLEDILTTAADDVTNVKTTRGEHYELVKAVKRDHGLLAVAKLPWIHAKVEDTRGTIVLIF